MVGGGIDFEVGWGGGIKMSVWVGWEDRFRGPLYKIMSVVRTSVRTKRPFFFLGNLAGFLKITHVFPS